MQDYMLTPSMEAQLVAMLSPFPGLIHLRSYRALISRGLLTAKGNLTPEGQALALRIQEFTDGHRDFFVRCFEGPTPATKLEQLNNWFTPYPTMAGHQTPNAQAALVLLDSLLETGDVAEEVSVIEVVSLRKSLRFQLTKEMLGQQFYSEAIQPRQAAEFSRKASESRDVQEQYWTAYRKLYRDSPKAVIVRDAQFPLTWVNQTDHILVAVANVAPDKVLQAVGAQQHTTLLLVGPMPGVRGAQTKLRLIKLTFSSVALVKLSSIFAPKNTVSKGQTQEGSPVKETEPEVLHQIWNNGMCRNG